MHTEQGAVASSIYMNLATGVCWLASRSGACFLQAFTEYVFVRTASKFPSPRKSQGATVLLLI